MTDFFTQLIEALESESRRRPGMNIAPETLAGLNSSPEKETPAARGETAEKELLSGISAPVRLSHRFRRCDLACAGSGMVRG